MQLQQWLRLLLFATLDHLAQVGMPCKVVTLTLHRGQTHHHNRVREVPSSKCELMMPFTP